MPSPPSANHPGWTGAAPLSLAVARERGGGEVAGRFFHSRERDLLADDSATIELEAADPRPAHGDCVRGLLRASEGGFRLDQVTVLTPSGREPTATQLALGDRRAALEGRAAIVATIRDFFRTRGFLEVETPARVGNPGLEPHLCPFPAGSDSAGQPQFLITSPELHLKRLLAAGYSRIFELARSFRDDESGRLHVSEFTMLEWYRAHAGLEHLADDLGQLLPLLDRVAAIHRQTAAPGCDITSKPDRSTYCELFRRHTGVDPSQLEADERDRLFVCVIEPQLGFARPLLLLEYPPDSASLARLVRPTTATGWSWVAARMELYVAGVELANGFDELTDATEQRRRHEADRAERERLGTASPPLDEEFLQALESGMPPAAGMALGVDRLVMVLLGADSVAAVRAFG